MSIKTENISIEDLIEKVKSYDDNTEDINLIRKAYEYAYRKHFSQKRIIRIKHSLMLHSYSKDIRYIDSLKRLLF